MKYGMFTWVKDFRIGCNMFAMVKTEVEGVGTQYGSIPYTCIDEQGRITKELSGLQMLLTGSPAQAIDLRTKSILVDDFRKANPDASEMDVLMFMASLYK